MIDIAYLVSYFYDSRRVLFVLICRYLHYLLNTFGLTQISVTEMIIHILVMQRPLVVYHGISHLSLVFSRHTRAYRRVCIPRKYKWQVGYSMVYYERALHDYFIPCHRRRQHNQCDKRAVHHGKVGCNTVEYTTAFLHSDWLYFLWHGINKGVERMGKTGWVNNERGITEINFAL